MLIIDPPSGWQYGFPKAVPEDVLKSKRLLRLWLIEQGYPAEDLEMAMKHSRYWEQKTQQ